jgi:D-arabinose 1-dehydrogenase-like Zn-dependent alcohol dehydrogenase
VGIRLFLFINIYLSLNFITKCLLEVDVVYFSVDFFRNIYTNQGAHGPLVPAALRATRKGGIVVCAGIHMSDIPSFEYALLWGERSVRSLANLTREDGDAFFATIECYSVTTHVQPFALARANEAIAALRSGVVDGAAVLVP